MSINWRPSPLEFGPIQFELGRFRIRQPLPSEMPGPLRTTWRSDVLVTLGEQDITYLKVAQARLLWSGIFLMLQEDEWLDSLGPGHEVFVTSMPIEQVDLTHALCYLMLAHLQEERVIAQDKLRLGEELLFAEQSTIPQLGEGEQQRHRHGSPGISEDIVAERQRIDWLESRHVLVDRALRDVRAAHPEIDVEALLPTYQEKLQHKEMNAHLEQSRHKLAKWWNTPHQGQVMTTHLTLGELVAQYGRFQLYSSVLAHPDGRRIPFGYIVRLAGEPPLLAATPWGFPVTPRRDRATMQQYIERWLVVLRQNIEDGAQAASQTEDLEQAAHIQEGLRVRQRQYDEVTAALEELSSDSHE